MDVPEPHHISAKPNPIPIQKANTLGNELLWYWLFFLHKMCAMTLSMYRRLAHSKLCCCLPHRGSCLDHIFCQPNRAFLRLSLLENPRYAQVWYSMSMQVRCISDGNFAIIPFFSLSFPQSSHSPSLQTAAFLFSLLHNFFSTLSRSFRVLHSQLLLHFQQNSDQFPPFHCPFQTKQI